MIRLLALAAALQIAPVQSDTSDAYLDARARELVALARARRQLADRSITRYQAVAKERISMGLRTRLRDRLFFRRETASRIDWRRGGPINITVLGAREAVPIATPKVQIPSDLKDFLPRLAFDPMDSEALLRIDTTTLRHPLTAGAEAHYRYRAGDSTLINLGERTITLYELEVIPRRRDFHLITGSFWIDAATHSVVQTTFRLAREFDLERDAEDEDDRREARQIPGFLKPIRADLQYVTIEFGLMHLRWWMPRLIAAEGVFQMGPVRTPLHYERSYAEYEVEGDSTAAMVARADLTDATEGPGLFSRPCRPRSRMSVDVQLSDKAPPDEIERRRQRTEERERARASADSAKLAADTARARRRREAEECAKLYTVTVADSSKLLTAAELPESIYKSGEVLSSDADLTKLSEQLKDLAEAPWQLPTPSFAWGLSRNGLIRYNKVEGLAVGVQSEIDLGRLKMDGTVRIGVAALEPSAELGISRASLNRRLRLAGYRKLDVMDQASGFGGFSASLSAFFLGRDERDYFRTTGIELAGRPDEAGTQWYDWRLFAEYQRPVTIETDFSLRHLLDDDHVFSGNRDADRANQVGAGLSLRWFTGQNPAALRAGAELHVGGSAGTYDFSRESLTLFLGTPLPFNLVAAAEVAAGTTTGPVPTQSLWYLGGSRSARGYSIGEVSGTAFWRARGEIGTAVPAARLTVFGDLGWAGDRRHVQDRASLLSVGVGASFLDGLVRVDLARALRGDLKWRLHASVDGIL